MYSKVKIEAISIFSAANNRSTILEWSTEYCMPSKIWPYYRTVNSLPNITRITVQYSIRMLKKIQEEAISFFSAANKTLSSSSIGWLWMALPTRAIKEIFKSCILLRGIICDGARQGYSIFAQTGPTNNNNGVFCSLSLTPSPLTRPMQASITPWQACQTAGLWQLL